MVQNLWSYQIVSLHILVTLNMDKGYHIMIIWYTLRCRINVPHLPSSLLNFRVFFNPPAIKTFAVYSAPESNILPCQELPFLDILAYGAILTLSLPAHKLIALVSDITKFKVCYQAPATVLSLSSKFDLQSCVCKKKKSMRKECDPNCSDR